MVPGTVVVKQEASPFFFFVYHGREKCEWIIVTLYRKLKERRPQHQRQSRPFKACTLTVNNTHKAQVVECYLIMAQSAGKLGKRR
jgi:hypothetical protein